MKDRIYVCHTYYHVYVTFLKELNLPKEKRGQATLVLSRMSNDFETFADRAKAAGRGIIVGGQNYGQGSSREHAALVPMYLGVRAVITKSFARIHVANLINAGIMPLTFKNAEDYDKLNQGDKLTLTNVFEGMDKGEITLKNETTGDEIILVAVFTERQKSILKAGGLLSYTKKNGEN